MRKLRFTHAPLDIAPSAPRYTPAAWRTLAAGLLILVLCSWPLARSFQTFKRAQESQAQAGAQLRARADAERRAQVQLNDPASLQKTKAQQQLQQMVRMSWFGLFDALENAAYEVHGGVSILSLIPSKTQPEVTQINLTALAANAPIMLEYIRILRKDPRIVQAELTGQQIDDRVGPGVIRMRLKVLWSPGASAARTAPPEVPTAPLSAIASTPVESAPVANVVAKRVAP